MHPVFLFISTALLLCSMAQSASFCSFQQLTSTEKIGSIFCSWIEFGIKLLSYYNQIVLCSQLTKHTAQKENTPGFNSYCTHVKALIGILQFTVTKNHFHAFIFYSVKSLISKQMTTRCLELDYTLIWPICFIKGCEHVHLCCCTLAIS